MLYRKTAIKVSKYIIIGQNSTGREAGTTSKEPNGGGKFEAVLYNKQITLSQNKFLAAAQRKRVVQLSEGIQPGNYCFTIVMIASMVTKGCRFVVSKLFFILY